MDSEFAVQRFRRQRGECGDQTFRRTSARIKQIDGICLSGKRSRRDQLPPCRHRSPRLFLLFGDAWQIPRLLSALRHTDPFQRTNGERPAKLLPDTGRFARVFANPSQNAGQRQMPLQHFAGPGRIPVRHPFEKRPHIHLQRAGRPAFGHIILCTLPFPAPQIRLFHNASRKPSKPNGPPGPHNASRYTRTGRALTPGPLWKAGHVTSHYRLLLQSGQHLLRPCGQMPHAGAASLIDGVDDGGMWSGERKLAHAGCAERAVLAGVFEVDQLDVVRDVLDVGQTGANERGVLLDILIVLGQGRGRCPAPDRRTAGRPSRGGCSPCRCRRSWSAFPPRSCRS